MFVVMGVGDLGVHVVYVTSVKCVFCDFMFFLCSSILFAFAILNDAKGRGVTVTP